MNLKEKLTKAKQAYQKLLNDTPNDPWQTQKPSAREGIKEFGKLSMVTLSATATVISHLNTDSDLFEDETKRDGLRDGHSGFGHYVCNHRIDIVEDDEYYS